MNARHSNATKQSGVKRGNTYERSITKTICLPGQLSPKSKFFPNERMDTVRIDKWLWAARFFKTRSLAARACELGRVQSNQQPVKPARGIHIGETFEIRTESGEYEVHVLSLSEIRGPAPIARALYEETQTSRDKRLKLAEERRAGVLFSPAPEHRPSKRDRRKIRDFRGE